MCLRRVGPQEEFLRAAPDELSLQMWSRPLHHIPDGAGLQEHQLPGHGALGQPVLLPDRVAVRGDLRSVALRVGGERHLVTILDGVRLEVQDLGPNDLTAALPLV